MHDIRKRLVHGITWATLGKVFLALSVVVTNVLITRLLPPEDVGTWFLLFSIIAAFALVAQGGLNQTVIRLTAAARTDESGHSAGSIIPTCFILATATTLLTAALYAGGAASRIGSNLFGIDLSGTTLALTTAWLALLVYRNMLAETFRGLSDFRLATLFEGLLDSLAFMLLLAALYGLYRSGSLEQVILLAVIACGLATIAAAVVLRRRLPDTRNGTSHPVGDILQTTWPLWITGITIYALGKIDLWILGLFRELDEVGVYGAVSRLAAVASFTLLVANSVVPPLISEMHSRNDPTGMERTLRSVATLSLIPAMGVVAVFAIWPAGLLGMLYGEFYRYGSSALLVLSAGHLVNVACGSCGYVLMMTRHQLLMMLITVFSGGVSLLVCWLLAPVYGGTGVAVGMSSALVLQNLLMLAAVRRHLGIWTHADWRMLTIGRKT